MKALSWDLFIDEANAIIARLRTTQGPAITRAAAVLGARLRQDGVVHVFGTGHSRAFVMELCRRAGGLAPFNAVTLDDLLQAGRARDELRNPSFERDPANAQALLSLHDIRPADAFIIASNSGRNGLIVEAALQASQRGLPLVAVTSLDHASRVSSRHPSGKRLHEVADVVIDNCAPYGDALLPVSNGDVRCCAVSSITGAFIAQALTAELVAAYLARGEIPPLLLSANVDGADARNDALYARFGREVRIPRP
jgi:uncharacterized phosphosugar-binding protein